MAQRVGAATGRAGRDPPGRHRVRPLAPPDDRARGGGRRRARRGSRSSPRRRRWRTGPLVVPGRSGPSVHDAAPGAPPVLERIDQTAHADGAIPSSPTEEPPATAQVGNPAAAKVTDPAPPTVGHLATTRSPSSSPSRRSRSPSSSPPDRPARSRGSSRASPSDRPGPPANGPSSSPLLQARAARRRCAPPSPAPMSRGPTRRRPAPFRRPPTTVRRRGRQPGPPLRSVTSPDPR